MNPGSGEAWGAILPTPNTPWAAVDTGSVDGWVDITVDATTWTPLDS